MGSGAIARGLARVAVDHHDVVLWARSESSAESAAAHVGEADVVTDLDALAECDVAVEAVTEDEQVKREVLGRLGRVLPEQAYLASTTSSLSVQSLAEASLSLIHI